MTHEQVKTQISEWFLNDGNYLPQLAAEVTMSPLCARDENLIIEFIDPHDYAIEIELVQYDLQRLVTYVHSLILFDMEGKGSRVRLGNKTRLTPWFSVRPANQSTPKPDPDKEVSMSLMCLKNREPCVEHMTNPESAKKDFFVLKFEREDDYAVEIMLARSDADRIVEYVEAKERLGRAFNND